METSGSEMKSGGRFSHPIWWVWAALSVAGGYYLWTRHETHVLQVVPYLILLACPLMHVFMHRGHGHGGHRHHGGGGEIPPQDKKG